MTYSTDTRTLRPGQTYVAIRGDLHDGHDFVAAAIEKGAAAVVVERDVPAPPGVDVIRVDDALAFLTGRASARVRAAGCPVVAITGSVGKTSTRSAVQAVLAESFRVVASTGNLNTPLGLSLVVLNAEIAPEGVLVLEMGARLPGDLAELTALFPPTVSVVTAVRGVHVETMGSLEGVWEEKSTLIRALGPHGTACLAGDDPLVRTMAGLTAGRVLLYGASPGCDVRPGRITADLPILGEHATATALAGVAVGQALGMDDAAINRGLGAIRPEKGRLARLAGRGGSVLVDDTYNASPDATLAALRLLATLPATRRVALLGDMLELGETEIAQHADVLEAALSSADVVVAVGPRMARAADTLADVGRVARFETAAGLAEALRAGGVVVPGPGDVLLVKGSQGVRMERVSQALLAEGVEPADVLARQTEAWKAIR